MADKNFNYTIEIERLNIDIMNLEVNLRKADFRKMQIEQELSNLDESKDSVRELIKSNKVKIGEMEKLIAAPVEEVKE